MAVISSHLLQKPRLYRLPLLKSACHLLVAMAQPTIDIHILVVDPLAYSNYTKLQAYICPSQHHEKAVQTYKTIDLL